MENRFILNMASAFDTVSSLTTKANPDMTRVNEVQVAFNESSPLNYQA